MPEVRRAVCPGSYDPPTVGHLDVIARTAGLFDEVFVAILVNPRKEGLFSVDERVVMLTEITADLLGVRVESFQGLVVDYCRERGARAMVKGLRGATDYDYELPMAHMNRHLTGVETLFLPGAPGQVYVSSSLVKEVARGGGDVTAFLPPSVHTRLLERLSG
ncbi:Phosphopantetheine adenylyltransferase [Pseudonocardia sp. Ae406_Ps2]|uniref:pantetheine-phosphate adenylyltransferase n=1 Tax=unclassified Pseudonocardia TaxID=2619320 RepID=UPI00094B610D|nr:MULTISPECIES: pantetheine-phosphate adenylyltransferase [unclassified Pseudonocardia]OLM02204.1 Phosphopantetheine adenylyltransferase [Pseudonocardia sp. Ae406_Ps2]OLM06013.1 Phosphopantetheine adenylyltransferase [Pseudonocardia sp. Ae331_Ps2]OLM15336.1 Phosphopantetheine adenylyltransferase [Pseudonocardia sp. Ae505_Ps2]OLM23776.1 Phosphopantetheine adenylyltransferase [Pseudonocardia sp. Ae706_Ps2]